jgi:hypothetical protein
MLVGHAASLLRPVLPMLTAVMYADYCAAIEPAERVYHGRRSPPRAGAG